MSTFDVIDQGDSLEIDASSMLRRPVFSHLNSWLALEIEGRPGLGLEFSAVPGKPVEIRPFEYPSGQPARAAYLTADNMLRVVEASSGEKGPYHLLQDPQGRQAERSACSAADQIRAGDQFQDREGAGTHDPADTPCGRRRGDRMRRDPAFEVKYLA